ncbi:ParB/RepB/Spo0J family partition protein [Pseudomonas sp. P66]|uniref:ParB/RepB/Spo0J family partition protein n=1 Tax=Pseudomonas arcuscaelestis TaxID=2710591 RepID=A0ABS2BZ89_9PSED|nr:ParB/RepB/Spo0J family partition protein [Pseudomonas arcuscaelestis]MBM5458936.1 ParB/RepB/Spo0J family partition protein [Pseudomonas arcuscaelestis]
MDQLDPKKLATLGIEQVPTTLMDIGLDQLFPGKWQKRKFFDDASLDELGDSMKSAGTNVVPLIVVPRQRGGGYNIVAGERRWRAAQRIGLATLKCEVGNYSFQQALFICAIENLQRADLNPIEEATSYQDLGNEFALSHDEIGRQLGKSRGHISNYLRLLQLDIRVRDALIQLRLTYGQARPLCALPHKVDQRRIAEKAIRLKWSVVQIQQAVNSITKKTPDPIKLSDTDADIRRLEREISEVTGLDCIVKRHATGRWQLGFNAPESESFSGLLERLGIHTDADFEK